MQEYLSQKTPFERALILAGAIWAFAKVIETLSFENDTCNYTLYHKRKLVYHGVAYEDRLDARLCEHQLSGKIFDDCVYDYARPRHKALKIERNRIKKDRPKYNIQHNI